MKVQTALAHIEFPQMGARSVTCFDDIVRPSPLAPLLPWFEDQIAAKVTWVCISATFSCRIRKGTDAASAIAALCAADMGLYDAVDQCPPCSGFVFCLYRAARDWFACDLRSEERQTCGNAENDGQQAEG
ncbi:hypothetical protein [Nitrobacter winogradskyi]|uniref:Uncharacterized protein n=2 Tax=Nitrobacter winogradskyi TaxID=913 RepID=A0ACC6AIZ3_NITWI|nr:hypothetical protein [Nitrobacter winogradskyi]MCP1999654.1 hypothetical protein [Nitrobacter winogradskyi]